MRGRSHGRHVAGAASTTTQDVTATCRKRSRSLSPQAVLGHTQQRRSAAQMAEGSSWTCWRRPASLFFKHRNLIHPSRRHPSSVHCKGGLLLWGLVGRVLSALALCLRQSSSMRAASGALEKLPSPDLQAWPGALASMKPSCKDDFCPPPRAPPFVRLPSQNPLPPSSNLTFQPSPSWRGTSLTVTQQSVTPTFDPLRSLRRRRAGSHAAVQ